MSQEELDMAKPISVAAITDYYRQNMTNILKSVSTSTVDSIDHEKYCQSSSETSSDSEIEKDESNIQKFSANSINQFIVESSTSKKVEKAKDIMKPNNINSIAIENSSDVHIGNKTFFNGPVTIKHIVSKRIKNIDAKTGSLGNTNEGYTGSHDNDLSAKCNDCKDENKNQKKEKKMQQNGKETNIWTKAFFIRSKILYCIGSILILAIAFVVLYYLMIDDNADVNEVHEIQIISREGWNAQKINDTLDNLVLPVKRVIICHTVTSHCDTKDECVETMKEIQKLHTGPMFNFSDIGYNFLIGGDGNIFEGRGWYKQGAHTSGYNRGSIGLAYIGNFVSELPNEQQIAAGFQIFIEGQKRNVLAEDYVIYGASQLRTTESPGAAFMKLIKTWPHAFKDS